PVCKNQPRQPTDLATFSPEWPIFPQRGGLSLRSVQGCLPPGRHGSGKGALWGVHGGSQRLQLALLGGGTLLERNWTRGVGRLGRLGKKEGRQLLRVFAPRLWYCYTSGEGGIL